MSTDDSGLYASHIGAPRTADEVRGYWLFVVGLVAGVLSIVLFLFSGPATGLREASIVVGGIGLALLVAGPVVRLPLRRTATYATYLGLVVCALALVWFLLVFPSGWSRATGNAGVIGLYAVGVAILGIAGVLIPLLTEATAAVDDEAAALRADRDAERAAREGAEDELDAEREERERLASELDAEREERADAAAESDAERERLQAELDSLRASQAQFELYEDNAEEWRWRLRHRNGNILGDGGEGYSSRSAVHDAIESVKKNAPGADTEE
jgi:uncharacterized protein YegP (UPF0339 family)